jgi:hypothetical protein
MTRQTPPRLKRRLDIAERFGFSPYDGMIVSSALEPKKKHFVHENHENFAL